MSNLDSDRCSQLGTGGMSDSSIAAPRGAPSQFWSVAGFLSIGCASYVVDTGLLMLLTQVFSWSTWSAGSLGYVASVILNFALNRILFRGRRGRSQLRHQTRRYLLLLGANYLVTIAGLSVAHATDASLFWSKTGLVAAISVWNFFLYRHWVFA